MRCPLFSYLFSLSPSLPPCLLDLFSPCLLSVEEVNDTQLVCQTGSSSQTGGVTVRVLFGKAERIVPNITFHYLDDPVITDAMPPESYYA